MNNELYNSKLGELNRNNYTQSQVRSNLSAALEVRGGRAIKPEDAVAIFGAFYMYTDKHTELNWLQTFCGGELANNYLTKEYVNYHFDDIIDNFDLTTLVICVANDKAVKEFLNLLQKRSVNDPMLVSNYEKFRDFAKEERGIEPTVDDEKVKKELEALDESKEETVSIELPKTVDNVNENPVAETPVDEPFSNNSSNEVIDEPQDEEKTSLFSDNQFIVRNDSKPPIGSVGLLDGLLKNLKHKKAKFLSRTRLRVDKPDVNEVSTLDGSDNKIATTTPDVVDSIKSSADAIIETSDMIVEPTKDELSFLRTLDYPEKEKQDIINFVDSVEAKRKTPEEMEVTQILEDLKKHDVSAVSGNLVGELNKEQDSSIKL